MTGRTRLEKERVTRLDVGHDRPARRALAGPLGPDGARPDASRLREGAERDRGDPESDGGDRDEPGAGRRASAVGYAPPRAPPNPDAPRMTEAHAWLAIVAAVIALVGLAASVSLRVEVGGARRWLDRTILAAIAVIALEGLLGLALVASGHAPTDLLHVVYGVAALLTLPLARWAGRSADLRRRALWVGGGSLILLGILFRLAQTG